MPSLYIAYISDVIFVYGVYILLYMLAIQSITLDGKSRLEVV